MKKIIYKCPICNEPLGIGRKAYLCSQNHSYDIAKEGYINLLIHKSSKEPGDSKLSVLSRQEFLNSGFYDILSNQLNKTVSDQLFTIKESSIDILDIGCGEGYYLSRLKGSQAKGGSKLELNLWGIDVSKPAIQTASKKSRDINFCVGNALSLPYLDNSVGIVFSIFAPFDAQEVSRVLKDDGLLVVVIPGTNHLSELVKLVYDNSKPHREDKDPIKGNTMLKLVDTKEVKDTITIGGKDKIMALLSMTPYYWSISLERKQSLEKMDKLVTDIDFKIITYKKTQSISTHE